MGPILPLSVEYRPSLKGIPQNRAFESARRPDVKTPEIFYVGTFGPDRPK
jgi:hypothetical protein